jgi:hypothetical protein
MTHTDTTVPAHTRFHLYVVGKSRSLILYGMIQFLWPRLVRHLRSVTEHGRLIGHSRGTWAQAFLGTRP